MAFWVWGVYDLFQNGIIRSIRSANALSETATAALLGSAFIFCMIVAYLLGSINWALVISRVFFHDDVREHGSGNAGTTNVLRTYGKKAAIFTFLGDGLKGVIAILITCAVFGAPMSEYEYLYLVTAAYFAAFFAVLGHVFPCFAKFRGGKGFATTAFAILALNPGIFTVLAAGFLTIVLGSHFVSLGSVVTVCLYPIMLSSFDSASGRCLGIHVLIAMFIGALVVWSHRANLVRLWNHTESKTYFFKKKEKKQAAKSDAEESAPAVAEEE